MDEAKQNYLNFMPQVIDSTPDFIFVKDRELRLVFCNKSYARLLGKTPEEIYGRTDIENGWDPELVSGNPGKGIRGFKSGDLEALSGKTARNSHEVVITNGEVIFADTIKMPLFDDKKQIIGLVGLGRDVTAQKKIAESLRDAQERINTGMEFLQNLIDGIPNPIFYKDQDCKYQACNNAFEQHIGKDRTLIIGKGVYDLAPKELADTYAEMDRRMLAGEKVQKYESKVKYADGSLRYVLFNKALMANADGKVLGIVGIITDITERKRLEKELQNKVWDLERANNVMKGREIRILELKERIAKLEAEKRKLIDESEEKMSAPA